MEMSKVHAKRFCGKFGNQYAYLLDAIYNPDSDESMTDEEKIKYFFDRFEKEYVCPQTIRLYPSECDRLEQWLRGLPSCINIAFYWSDIIEIGKSWGFCTDEKKEEKFCERWWHTIAFRLLHLRNCL